MNAARRFFLVAAVLVAPLLPSVSAAEDLPFYVGREVCLKCHATDRAHAACKLRTDPAHLQSHAALSRPEAAHIAFVSGVAEAPQESLVCLECHSTGAAAGPRWARPSFDPADGVQCEACHGAGSLHADARRSGTGDTVSTAMRKPRNEDEAEAACATCHMQRSSHESVLADGYRRPPAQSRYKTPVNLTVSPDGSRLYVVCQNSNSVVVLDPGRGRVLVEHPVGKRPHDAALHPDGRTLYVTNRLSGTLTVIDTASGQTRAEIAVGAEPHGVLTDPEGRRVYVLATGQNAVSVLDAGDLTPTTRLAAGVGPWSMALAPDGASLWVTNSRSNPVRFRDPPVTEITVVQPGSDRVVRRPRVVGANMLQGVAFVPGHDVVLFTLMRTKNLVPMSRIAQGWVITNGLGVLWPDGRVDQVLLDEPHASFPDPNDVAVAPDGRHALVTSGGSDRVAVIDVAELLATIRAGSNRHRAEVLPNHLGASSRFVVQHIEVGRNPRGVAFSPDGRSAFVANALDDTVTVIETAGFTVSTELDLGGSREITDIRRGERLFHSAAGTYGRQFSCRSCHPDGHTNGLAFDIEADGLGLMPVNNRSLRGIQDTAPFKWEGTNPSLERQCGARLAVFFTRLDPFAPDELAALVRYTTTIERPPNPNRAPDGLTPAQRRGQLIFERTVTRDGRRLSTAGTGTVLVQKSCAACHSGGYKTARILTAVGTDMWFDAPVPEGLIDLEDDDSLGTYGIVHFSQSPERLRPFDVPHLNNIYDSAPYLHNGAARTLEEIWTRFNIYDWHGVTGDLTRRQFNDLIAYLKAL
jgi:YVTN family beta-propeller protein